MSPIALVAQSEFRRRVRSKWFIATTLLAPALMILVVAAPILVITASDGAGSDGPRMVALLDQTGQLGPALSVEAPEGLQFVEMTAPADSLRQRVLDGDLYAALVVPPGILDGEGRARYLSRSGGGMTTQSELRGVVRSAVRAERARQAGAGPEVLDALDASAGLDFVTVTEDGDAEGGAEVGFLVANVLGLMVYIAVLLYGAMVMRGVIEEKTNRIVEVVVSSVRPFDLLMGKVLGIGAVGLVQMIAWGALLLGLNIVAAPVLAMFLSPQDLAATSPGAPAPGDTPFDPSGLAAVLTPGLVVAFVLFFLGGYLLFASLFAAVGSMVDQESDAQSLQVPVILPIIVPLLFLPYVVDKPESALSVGLSLFPLSSPVLMVVRMSVVSVPLWQVVLALALLGAAFVGAVWLASRIYRVGILMTGKKASFRDLARWVREA